MTDVALAIRAQMDAQEATSGLADIADAASSTSDAVQESAEAAAAASESYSDVSSSAKGMAGASRVASGSLKAVAGGLDAVGFSGAADKLNQVAEATSFLGGVSKAFTAVQAGLNAVMAANPVFLVVIAVVALVAALVIAYKKSETFRDIVNAAFKSVSKIVGEVVDFIKDHWKLLFVILTGPIGLAILQIAKHWDEIKAGGAAVVDWVKDHFGDVKDLVTKPFSDAKTLILDIWDKITGAVSTAKDTISTAIDGVKASVQGVVDTFQAVLDKIESVLGKIADLKDKAGDLASSLTGGLLRTAGGGGSGTGSLNGLRIPDATEEHVHVHLDGATFVGNEYELARALERVLGGQSRRILGIAGA